MAVVRDANEDIAMGDSCTWYEVCAIDGRNKEIDNSSHISLEEAKGGIRRFMVLYPGIGRSDGGMIFVRQYLRGKRNFRVLHKLTVKEV